MSLKLLVFDLDGTLAPIGRPILPEIVEGLRTLEDRGMRIAFCSGKPVFYLCGLARQLGLKQPILLGENGADMQIGVDLPPAVHETLPYSREAKQTIRFLRDAFEELLPHLWYQPNKVMLTPFSWDPEEHAILQRCMDENADKVRDVDIYHHIDCYDIVPKGISKSEGLRALGRRLGIAPEETAAIGDGVNDYPMFAYAGTSIGIHLEDADKVTYNMPDIQAAFRLLLGNAKEPTEW